MTDLTQFYIDGQWVAPVGAAPLLDVVNPATEAVVGRISMGGAADVDRAVKAARRAFLAYSRSSREERLALFERISAGLEARAEDLAQAVTAEMGAPLWLSRVAHVAMAIGHFKVATEILRTYPFSESAGTTQIVREAIGVCGMITPWNWPLNQIAAKLAPALAVGCTMVLKPSEIAPLSAHVLAEVLDAAGVPAGVFNLVDGDGPGVGTALSTHPEIDLVSFTGSTRAGIAVAKAAADTVKRVHQELGGKSANIILDDADFQQAVTAGVDGVMLNSGQTCNAPTRMLVPANRMDEAIAIARAAAEAQVPGDPLGEAKIGPVASQPHWTKIQGLIETGIAEGAELVSGGPGKPEGLDQGYYVKPTVFARVTNDMTIAREEIFGPVLSIIGYQDEADAVRIANDTPYGLAAYVSGGDLDRVRDVASRLQAGQVLLNSAAFDITAPFGGYKQSGNGREWGAHAFGEFVEVKAIMGFNA